ALDSAVSNSINAGVVYAVASGNDNADACNSSPSRVPAALTAASSASNDSRSSFSNWGSCIDLFAPGSSITSAWHTSTTATNTISGTSMASPHIAGVAALYLAANPGASASQVNTAVINAATANKITDVKGSPNRLLYSFFDGSTPPPPVGNVLTKGVAVSNLSASTGNSLNFTMDVPAGASNLTFNISGGTGDADMYVKFGTAPTDTSYDCRPYLNGNTETCSFATPQAGTYHVRLKAFSSFSGVSLIGDYGTSSAVTYTNGNNVTISDNTTVESPIAVSNRSGSAPSSTPVAVNIVHTYIGDLKVDLVAPDGSIYTLHNRSGGSADNINTTYNVNLSTEALNGTWKLRVNDNANADTGYINSWSITF
nr:proprotein convertase P-domain-containing protein [Lysobacter sp.]